MKVIFILSDANRWDYLQYMPFLRSKSKDSYYVEKIVPGIGFCEISEYISGKMSLENGNIFQITFNGNYGRKKYNLLEIISCLSTKIPKLRWSMAKKIDSYLYKNANIYDKNILKVRYAIPINMINYFSPTESIFEYDSFDFFGKSNLFVKLKESGYTYDISDFVMHNKIQGTNNERIDKLLNKINKRELKDFTLLYIGTGEIAHIRGTNSSKFHRELTKFDSQLREIYLSLKTCYKENFCFMVLGDHGMVDVNTYVNVKPLLKKVKKKYKINVGEDYVYFIDSTCLRLWVKDKKNILGIDQMIGEALNEYIDNTIDIKKIDKKYGDLIYMLRPGCVLFPDFFNMYKQKGMHGYNNKISEQWGMCVAMGNIIPKKIEMMKLTDVKKIVVGLFGLKE